MFLKKSYSLSIGALQSDFVFSEFKIFQYSRGFVVRSFLSLFIRVNFVFLMHVFIVSYMKC